MWQANLEERGMPFVSSGSTMIHYRVEGDGPPLVLHHGFGGSSLSWYDFGYVAALVQHYQLVMIDARGHGHSDKPHDPNDYGLRNQVSDLLAVLEDVGIEQTRYYGYSMGAQVGYGLCKYAPERLACLGVGGFSPAGSAPERARQVLGLLRQGPPAWIAALEADGPIPPDYRERVMTADFDAYIALWENWATAPDPTEKWFVNFPGPRLVLIGSEDRAYESARALCRDQPGVNLVVLDGLNHGAGLTRSDIALSYIEPFLASVPS